MKASNTVRFLAAILAMMLLLVACGTTDSPDISQAQDTSENDTSSNTAAPSATSDNFNPEGYPIVNEQITVSMMGSKAGIQGAWETLQFFEKMEDMTNIAFTFDTPDSSVLDEKKNLALAGGSYPEVFFAADLTTAQQVKYGMEEQILIPLDGLIEEYAPYVQAMFEQYPEVKRSITAPDGHIYALPNFNQAFLAKTPTFWYNAQWLEALEVDATDLPTTTEGFYELLVRFKNEDPNGNGIDDEIPFTLISENNIDNLDFNTYFLPAFGILNARIYVEDDVVKYGYLQENYVEFSKYIRRLHEEGLVDPEWITQDDSTRIGKAKNNLVGIASQALPTNLYDVTALEEAQVYPIAPALTSEYSDGTLYRLYNDGITPGAFALTDKCENPEAMIRWVDYLYSEEGSLFIHYGEEGVWWEYADDDSGRWIHIEPDNGMTQEEYRGGFITPDCGSTTPKWVRASTPINWVDPLADVRVTQVEEKLLPYGQVAFPTVYLMPEQQSRIDVLESDINKYVQETEAAFFTGSQDIDTYYDTFVETLERMNIQELIGIYQDAYDLWLTSK